MGKFMSVDPLTRSFPMLTPYQFASNSPIAGIDLDGKEFEWYMLEKQEELFLGTSHLKKFRTGVVKRSTKIVVGMVHAPEAIKNTMDYIYGNADVYKFCVTGDCGNLHERQLEVLMAVSRAIYEDYSDLVHRAANGDAEAMGEIAVEAGLLLIELDEIRHFSKVKTPKSVKKSG